MPETLSTEDANLAALAKQLGWGATEERPGVASSAKGDNYEAPTWKQIGKAALGAAPLTGAAGVDYIGRIQGAPTRGLEGLAKAKHAPWMSFPQLGPSKGSRSGEPLSVNPLEKQWQEERPQVEAAINERFPRLQDDIDAVSADSNLFQPRENFLKTFASAAAVHGTRAAAMMIPGGQVLMGAGFLQMERKEQRSMIETYAMEQGLDLDPNTVDAFVQFGGTISGAIEYAEHALLTQSLKGTILKSMFQPGQLQKMVFGKLGPRVGAFVGSQVFRGLVEGVEEWGQEEVKMITLNALIFDQNKERKEKGLAELPYISLEEMASKGFTAFQTGLSAGLVIGSSGGAVSGMAHERALSKKKAKRKLSQEMHRDKYLSYKAVRDQMEIIGPKITGHVDEERRQALNQAEEADLWVKVRELQQNLNTPAEAMPKVEDYEGANAKEQLINFIMANSVLDDQWVLRYEQLLHTEIEQNTELGAADKLLMKFQLTNPDNKPQDVWALRTILDSIADNIINEDGTYAYPEGINEVAEKFTTEIGKEMSTVKFLQSQMENFEEGSLEQLFLEGFITRHVYKNMPVSKAAGFFDVTENEASSVDEAYTQAVANQTRKFQEAIKARLAQADTDIKVSDVRGLLLLLKAQEDTDTGQIDYLLQGRRLEQELADLGGEINPARDAGTPAVQKFLDNYVEVINNLIYHTVSNKKASHRQSRDIAVNFIGETLGGEFLQMLRGTMGHQPFIKPADTPKGLTLQIIEELATQLEGEIDPARREEIKRSLKVYQDRAKTQAGAGYTFAQEAADPSNPFGGKTTPIRFDTKRATKISQNYAGAPALIASRELLQNSKDAIDKRWGEDAEEGRILYALQKDDEGGDWFVFADNGMGMAPLTIVNKYLPGFVSGKEGAESSGGFGIANLEILGKALEFELHTIYHDPQYGPVLSILKGDGMSYERYLQGARTEVYLQPNQLIELSEGLTLEFGMVNNKTVAAGTTIRLKYNGSMQEGENFLIEQVDYIPNIQIEKMRSDKYTESEYSLTEMLEWSGEDLIQDSLMSQGMGSMNNMDTYKTYAHPEEIRVLREYESEGSKLAILQPIEDVNAEVDLDTSTWFEIAIVSKGILQFKQSFSFNEEVSLPRGLYVDLRSTVPAEDSLYPYTPTRESLSAAGNKAVKKFIQEVGLGIKKETTNAYQKALKDAPRFESGSRMLDGSQSIPVDLLEHYISGPDIQAIEAIMHNIVSGVTLALGRANPHIKEMQRATYAGLMTNTGAYGVHFGRHRSADPSQIYMNPILIMRDAVTETEHLFLKMGWDKVKKPLFPDSAEDRAQKAARQRGEDTNMYVAPENIWGDITKPVPKYLEEAAEPSGLSFTTPDFYEKVWDKFVAKSLGIAVHEAFHQIVTTEGKALAREFTFEVGEIVETLVRLKEFSLDSVANFEGSIESVIKELEEYGKEFEQYRNTTIADKLISSQGGDFGSWASDDIGKQRDQEIRESINRKGDGTGSTRGVESGVERRGLGIALEDHLKGKGVKERDWARQVTEAELLYSQGKSAELLAMFPDVPMSLRTMFENAQYVNPPKKAGEEQLGFTFNQEDRKNELPPDIDPILHLDEQVSEATAKYIQKLLYPHHNIDLIYKTYGGVTGQELFNQTSNQYGDAGAKRFLFEHGFDGIMEDTGIELFQEGRQAGTSTVVKGTTEFLADGRAHMKFFRTADISTVAHEFMHILSRHMSKEQTSAAQLAFVREEFKNLDDKSKQDFLAKLEIVWDLFLTDPTDPILIKPEAEMLLRGYMEHVARQFEKYLFQGTAPTRALTSAFKSVRDSMRVTYEKISDVPDIRADLDPVIKNVFDQMVAGSRAVTTPVAKQVLIEGGVYTVFVSRSSDKIVKTLLKKLREGYSEVQGMHDDILRYAESVMGKKFLRDSDFKLRLSKAGTYAEGKAVIDYIDRQLFQKQKKYHKQMVDEIKQIVGAVEFEKIDKSFGKLIKDEIADIDFKKMTPKKLNSLHSMRAWLTTNLRKGIISTDMMNISLVQLKQLDRLSQKNIYDFTIQELQMLRDALGTIIKEGEQKQFLRIKKKILILNRESERLVEYGKTLTPKDKYSGLEPNPNAKTEEDKVKGVLGGMLQAIRMGGTQPHRLLLYIANFDKDNPLYNFVKIIREGTRVISERHVNDMEFMRDLISSVGGAQHWSKKRIPETETIDERYLSHYKVTNNLGKEVELHLTKAERLSIYMYSLNEDALRHMVEGGIVMPQNKGTGINYKLTPETLAEIISEITMEEKYVAHQMMQYYQDQVATAINKVSSNLLGYGLAKEENYFPIFAEGKARGNTEVLNKPQLSKTMDQFQRKLIDRMDFLKSRTKSPSPLYIHDAFWAMEMNLQDVNRYVGLAEPLNFVKALWRDTDNKETGIYYSVARSWGPDVVRTIDTWIDRIEDPSTAEGPEGKFIRARRRTAIAAQLGANVFVSMYQRVSLMLATNYDISRVSIGQAMIANSGPTQGFGIGAAHSMKEMARLIPELAPRFETGPNVDVHELFMDSMTRHAWSEPKTGMDDVRAIHNWETFKTAVNTLSVTSAMKFIKENDAWALSTIWDAVNIEAKKKGWNEAQIREKFLEIYYNTQPNYDTENISLMMSDKRALHKIAFATYQTMPNQIYNEVEYHIREWGVKNKSEKDKRTRSMNTIRMIDKVVTTLVAQQLAINMIRELRYLGDDDDEPYFKSVFLGTLRSMIAVLPYVGGLTADLISAFADPTQRYNSFDTPGSFVIQLYKGAGIDAVEGYESMKDGDLAAAAYSGLRLAAKLLGISKGYAWETVLNQVETVTDKLVD